MVRLYDRGVYLVNGTEIAKDEKEGTAKTGQEISSEERGRIQECMDELKEKDGR